MLLQAMLSEARPLPGSSLLQAVVAAIMEREPYDTRKKKATYVITVKIITASVPKYSYF
jgi:hypothetical protein